MIRLILIALLLAIPAHAWVEFAIGNKDTIANSGSAGIVHVTQWALVDGHQAAVPW